MVLRIVPRDFAATGIRLAFLHPGEHPVSKSGVFLQEGTCLLSPKLKDHLTASLSHLITGNAWVEAGNVISVLEQRNCSASCQLSRLHSKSLRTDNFFYSQRCQFTAMANVPVISASLPFPGKLACPDGALVQDPWLQQYNSLLLSLCRTSGFLCYLQTSCLLHCKLLLVSLLEMQFFLRSFVFVSVLFSCG